MGRILKQDDPGTDDHVRDERETKRQRLTSMKTSRDMSGAKADNTFCNHVNGGELNAHEVHKARQVEVEHLSKMLVFKRAPHDIAKSHMRRDPIKVRCVDTWNSGGIHRRRLMAKEFRKGSRCEAFANFSALPPLELVKMMISMVATAQRGEGSLYGEQNVAGGEEIVMMHTDISRWYFHAPSNEEKYEELPGGMWTSNYPVYGRLRVSLYGTRDASTNWEDAYAKVLMERRSTRGVASPCSFYP